jgi:hypothetical protein
MQPLTKPPLHPDADFLGLRGEKSLAVRLPSKQLLAKSDADESTDDPTKRIGPPPSGSQWFCLAEQGPWPLTV